MARRCNYGASAQIVIVLIPSLAIDLLIEFYSILERMALGLVRPGYFENNTEVYFVSRAGYFHRVAVPLYVQFTSALALALGKNVLIDFGFVNCYELQAQLRVRPGTYRYSSVSSFWP